MKCNVQRFTVTLQCFQVSCILITLFYFVGILIVKTQRQMQSTQIRGKLNHFVYFHFIVLEVTHSLSAFVPMFLLHSLACEPGGQEAGIPPPPPLPKRWRTFKNILPEFSFQKVDVSSNCIT